jgi:pimeloyl-ACP methyl ester carboxylesterase
VIGVGHSVGGVATVYAALKQPERFSHLILIDPTFLKPRWLWSIRLFRLAGQGHRLPFVRGAMRRRRLWASAEDAFHHLSSRSLFKRWQPDVLRAFIDSAVVPTTPNGNAPATTEVTLRITPEWEARLFQTVATDVWRLPAQLRRLKIPTLVLRGDQTDVFTPISERLFRQGYPEAQIETVPGAGHLIPQEQPDAVGQVMVAFLQRMPRP